MRRLLFLVLLLAGVTTASSAERMAVLDLKPVGVDTNLTMAVSENLRTMIIESGNYKIVERSQVDKLLEEYRLVQTGLTEDSQAQKIGSLANVDLVLIGSLGKIFDCYTINVRIIKVATGVVVKALKAEIKSPADFPTKIDDLALRIGTPGDSQPALDTSGINLSGLYRTIGYKYVGQLTISKDKDIYLLSWIIDNSQTGYVPQSYKGNGILHGGVLSVYYQNLEDKNDYGVAAYEVLLGGQQLRGLYTNLGTAEEYGKVSFENGVKQN